jgi:gas vesicle protein
MNDRVYYSRDAELRAQRERASAVLVFMALGLGIGTILALLFAPKRGEEVRSEIASTLGESFDSGREATNKAVGRLEKDFSEFRKKVEERLER